MKIPSKDQCFKLMKDMKMLDHIIDHSIAVANVALFLSFRLKKIYPRINIPLTMSAALLHDITKTRSFETKEIHSHTGGIMLSDMGYPEVGNIIRQHVVLDASRPNEPVMEYEIVNYSDKRTLNDQVVSLTKRMEYIQLKYNAGDEFKERFQRMMTESAALEKKIFDLLDISPDQLAGHIKQEITKEDYNK